MPVQEGAAAGSVFGVAATTATIALLLGIVRG
jgi:hypothetical protein